MTIPGPELAFACACLAPHPAEPLVLPEALDEQLFTRICRRHAIVGPVVARLRAAGMRVPTQLARSDALGERASMRQLVAMIALRDVLGAAGIPVLFLKGAALSQLVWGSPLVRRGADIDVLIPAGQVDTAWAALSRAGYDMASPHGPLPPARARLYRRVAKDSQHRDPFHGVVIELHWRMSDEMAQPCFPPACQRQEVRLGHGPSGEQAVETLAHEALFVYLCSHGAAHAWARVKWLADVAALLAQAPDGGAGLWRHARACGAEVPAASAVFLAGRLLGSPAPPGFVAPRSWRLAVLNRLAWRTLTAGNGAQEHAATPWRGWVEMAAKAMVAHDARGRMAVLRRLLIAGDDVAGVPLPRWLFALYPVLRLPMLLHRRIARRSGQAAARRLPCTPAGDKLA